MMTTVKNNSDFLFIYDATNTNPNGDADQENKPRMDMETKTLLVSDVRRKRDVRDFLSNKGYEIFVNTLDGDKVTMDKMFDVVMKKYKIDSKANQQEKIKCILSHMLDMRIFGSAMAVGGITRTFTGPVQMGWGYSLHPVDLVKSSSIVTIMNEDNSTFGKVYKAHYAMIAQSGSINKFAAAKTGMSNEDKDLFIRALIQSMMNNLTHSKQGQKPLLYLEVEYDEGFDGYLGDLRRFMSVDLQKQNAIRQINEISLDFAALTQAVNELKSKGYVKDVYLWKSSLLQQLANLPETKALDLLKPIPDVKEG